MSKLGTGDVEVTPASVGSGGDGTARCQTSSTRAPSFQSEVAADAGWMTNCIT